MIECIIIIAGIIGFLTAMFDKKNIWDTLSRKSMKVKSKALFAFLNCSFCFMFHVGWLLTVLYGTFVGFKWWMIIVPFVVSGLMYKKGK